MFSVNKARSAAFFTVLTGTLLSPLPAVAQCVGVGGALASVSNPIDLNFGDRTTARVISTGDFDGVSGNETAITPDGYPIIRVDIGQAGIVTVNGNGNLHTYTFPGEGAYVVVFPYEVVSTGTGGGRVVFRVVSADGDFSGGTQTWSDNNEQAPLKVLTTIDAVSTAPAFCATMPEAVELPRIARAAHRLALAEIGTLRSREPAFQSSDGRYSYARAFGAETPSGDNLTGLIAGAGLETNWGRTSGFVSVSRAGVNADDLSSEIDAVGLGVSTTVLTSQGYLDVVGKFSTLGIDLGDASPDATTNGTIASLSAEVGATEMTLGQNILTPEAQIVVSSLDIDKIALNGGGTAAFEDTTSVHGRIGVGVERPWTAGTFFARADMWHEFESGSGVSIDSEGQTTFDPLDSESWVDLSIGLSQSAFGAGQFRGSVTSRVGEDDIGWGGELTLSFPF